MGSSLKKYLSVFLIVLVIGVLAACNSKESTTDQKSGDSSEKKEEQVVEFWTIALQPTFNDYFKDVIAKFEEDNPGVKIDWKDFPYDAVQNKLLTSIASGNAPGVVNLNTSMANQMGTKDALVDFNAELSDEEKAAYFEGIYSSTEIDGKANALPWYTGLPVLFINKDLVEKAGLDPNNPPTTKKELNEWGKTIKDKTGAYGYVFTMESRSILEEGYQLLSDDFSKAAFNTGEVKDYIKGNIDLMKAGVIPKDVLNYDKQVQLFGSEQVGMILSSASFINQIKTASPDVYEKMVAVPSPVGDAGIRFSNTMNLVVPAKTKNKDAAVDFAVYVSNAENQLAFSKVASTLPSTVESAKDAFFSKNDGSIEGQALTASAGSLDKATDFYIGIAAASDVNASITKHLQNIYLNEADIDAELSAAEKEVNDIIAKNK
ncbi:ABC transporter substrate-binding protein [Neobacillus niacini]|uniref:ABC transporter substrate-binding protein n=1 Tax=Neobacillus niacini TaxID=86668 RepID=UPI0005ED7299|nr:sugar ABC transporter substrate-binding protein [Neobacillus niacini]